MNSELENWQINFEMKQAKRELFNDDPMGCYNHESEHRCTGCNDRFDPNLNDKYCDDCIRIQKEYIYDTEN